jgi:ATP-binding cassette subfamily B protein
VGILPILLLGVFLITKKAGPAFRKMFKAYDRLNNVVQENLRGIRVVKSYVREERESEKFRAAAGEVYDLNRMAERTMSFAMPMMQLCVYAAMILISWFGARLVVGGELSTGDLTSVFTYSMQILMSLMMVSMVIVMITMSRASGERIVELLAETPELVSPDQPVTEVKDGSICFRDVAFSYTAEAEEAALSGVNLTIPSGQTVGILGGTGSGKSTLVQLIPRLYDVTAGSVEVGGVDVRAYDLKALRDAVAMVLQKNELFSGTIRENLRWGDEDATDEELVHACTLACAHDFIQGFPQGYDTHIEQGGTNLSGGQKQRLCIARALLKKPRILILDDSTSAVDTHTDGRIRQAFRKEIPDTTKLIIAQRVSSVQDADQIIVLDNGRIHGVGTHEELLAGNTIYQELYASQQKGGLQ